MIGYKLIKAGLKSVFQTRDALETMVVQSLEWFKYNEIPTLFFMESRLVGTLALA